MLIKILMGNKFTRREVRAASSENDKVIRLMTR
jgi:hypothetical protein